ncbi:hypothetical protein AB6A40_008969 [Gnathostoma spinigerum]|uniref:Uncharacterized protein n=1 Tax=Gnathostoma spinigerum TaxID=75299 RepID=A0ABD6F0N8_9BILA
MNKCLFRNIIRNYSVIHGLASGASLPSVSQDLQVRSRAFSLSCKAPQQALAPRVAPTFIKDVPRFTAAKARLVIFDKDGTLICFNAMWVPWAENTAKRIDEMTNANLKEKVFCVLGYDEKAKRVRPGLLAEGTMRQIQDRLTNLLVTNGINREKASMIVDIAVHDTNYSKKDTVKQLSDLHNLFEKLHRNDIKIAVCTSDSRSVLTFPTRSHLFQ